MIHRLELLSRLLDVPTSPLFGLLLGATALYVAYHYGAAGLNPRGRKLTGGLVLGLGSVGLLLLDGADLATSGLGWADTTDVLPVTAVLALVVLPIVARAARAPAVRATLQPAGPGPWIVYLIGYELFFRGLLLLGLVPHVGASAALGISTALYVLQHLTKHAAETVSTLVMGVVFGQLALVSGAIWAPTLLHVAIALGSERAARRSWRATNSRR